MNLSHVCTHYTTVQPDNIIKEHVFSSNILKPYLYDYQPTLQNQQRA